MFEIAIIHERYYPVRTSTSIVTLANLRTRTDGAAWVPSSEQSSMSTSTGTNGDVLVLGTGIIGEVRPKPVTDICCSHPVWFSGQARITKYRPQTTVSIVIAHRRRFSVSCVLLRESDTTRVSNEPHLITAFSRTALETADIEDSLPAGGRVTFGGARY
eukprot:scaffold519693_cov19-Prasinocladus_malaysianus.AAC.1